MAVARLERRPSVQSTVVRKRVDLDFTSLRLLYQEGIKNIHFVRNARTESSPAHPHPCRSHAAMRVPSDHPPHPIPLSFPSSAVSTRPPHTRAPSGFTRPAIVLVLPYSKLSCPSLDRGDLPSQTWRRGGRGGDQYRGDPNFPIQLSPPTTLPLVSLPLRTLGTTPHT